ncbi:MAG: ABC transporter permease [Actinomycetaceae bacterium]|nr:ABC transporter permease [Actinomycetaceae bacterium]
MFKYIAKRIGISFVVLLIASVLLFVLTINSGDPLKDLRESNNRNRDNLMAQRTQIMGLDRPWYVRYWDWLAGVSRCFAGSCDFGRNRSGLDVNDMLASAAASTIRLVLLSVILSIVVGVFFGVMTAIRQYSGFDYVVTFLAFVFFSLPSFVFAVLLKEYGAIRFNNWLSEPRISLTMAIVLALLFALLVQAMGGGSRRRRLITGGATFAITVVALQIISATQWIANPATESFVLEIVVGIAAAVLMTSLFTGLSNRRALACTLGTAAAVLVLLLIVQGQLWEPTWGLLAILLVAVVAIGALIGRFFGGYARGSVAWASVWTAVSVFLAACMDFMARYWTDYVALVRGRAISTTGSVTPNFKGQGVFWHEFIDTSTHLLLPTITLTLLSVASYTRYTRSSMLEVLGQDYIRTARAKGLPERTVITRHAFRNAMIPITTIVAYDFASLIGGAVITERVFGWKGMGELFITGLDQVDPAPVMAFFVVTGSIAILMNLVADIAYAYIDPRIRR